MNQIKQQHSSHNVDHALQELSRYNEQILNLVNREDFNRLLSQYIRDNNSRKFLADLFLGKNQLVKRKETGIISLITCQNKYLLGLNELKADDTILEKSKQKISTLLELII